MAAEALGAADRDRLRRALDYPYDPHPGCFLFRGGAAETVAPGALHGEGRIAVLPYGSNRAPAQLMRKFGSTGEPIAVEEV